MPFKAKSFDTVYCSHLVEHMKRSDVYGILDEIIRVARYKITVKVPHRLTWTSKLKMHHSFFDVKWWDRWLSDKRFVGKIWVDIAFVGKFLGVIPLPRFEIVMSAIVSGRRKD